MPGASVRVGSLNGFPVVISTIFNADSGRSFLARCVGVVRGASVGVVVAGFAPVRCLRIAVVLTIVSLELGTLRATVPAVVARFAIVETVAIAVVIVAVALGCCGGCCGRGED